MKTDSNRPAAAPSKPDFSVGGSHNARQIRQLAGKGKKRKLLCAAWCLALALTGSAATAKAAKEQLILLPPSGGTALSHYLQRMPLDAIYTFNGEKLQIKQYPGFGFSTSFTTGKAAPGKQRIRLTGKALGDQANISIYVQIIGHHFDGDKCAGPLKECSTFEFKTALDRKGGTLEFPFELINDRLRCEFCNRTYPCIHVALQLRLEAPEDQKTDLNDYGVELSSPELVTTFPLQLPNRSHTSTTSWLVDTLKKQQQEKDAWRQKHRKYFQQCARQNRIDAAKVAGFPQKAPQAKEFAFFSPAELSALNPAFEVRRIAAWPFYRQGVYPESQLPYRRFPDAARAFIRNGKAYTVNSSALTRFDPATGKWNYLVEEIGMWSKKIRKFPEDAGLIGFRYRQPVRLSDGAKLKLPPEVSLSDGQTVFSSDRIFYIAKGRKAIMRANADFSQTEALTFAAPEFPGVKMREIRNIHGFDDGKRLLIEYAAEPVNVWLELDLTANQCQFKLPPGKEPYTMQMQSNNWSFRTSRGVKVYDLGANRTLATLKGKKENKFAAQMKFYELALDDTKASMLENSCRVGSYAAAWNRGNGAILLLNLLNPAESLRLNGFELFTEIKPGASADSLEITMPDGLYEVRPKTMPPFPDMKIELPEPPKKIDIAEVVTGIEANTPAIFNAVPVDGGLRFDLKATTGRPVIVLDLKLPPAEDTVKNYCFLFDANTDSLFFNPENAAGERDGTRRKDSRTLLVPKNSVKLNITLERNDAAKTLRLIKIEPETR